MTTISNAVVVAYWQCPRKAFLFNTTQPQLSHLYVALLDQMKRRAYEQHLSKVKAKHPNVVPCTPFSPAQGGAAYVDVVLQSGDLEASCDFLTRLSDKVSVQSVLYEPSIVVGTHQVTVDQKIELAFVGHVLGLLQSKKPDSGIIISANGQSHRIQLQEHYVTIAAMLTSIRANAAKPTQPPPVFLVDHCACCQFRTACLEVAEKADDLSLLSRMNPKIAGTYRKKGIFTVNQLSHTFRPRKSRKPRTNPVVHFKFELQALAIRTGQIYIQHLPDLPQRPVELFMDIEGIPDQGFDYLIGLLVCEGEATSYYRFWTDMREGELQMWETALTLMRTYPEAPIYHYGSYEPRAMERLRRSYQVDCTGVSLRLVNINASIYGKVYFPTRSNGLKDLGRILGCTWTSSDATGLMSLVWRQQWEDTQDNQYKETLLTYNQEDCQALRALTLELRRLSDKPAVQANVEIVGASNRKATPVGDQIHRQFDAILKSAHAGYNERKINLQDGEAEKPLPSKKRGAQEGHRSTSRPVPKPTRVVSLDPLEVCPICPGGAVKPTKHIFEKSIVDLVFTKNGCRKTITKYRGQTVFCPKCRRNHRHPLFDEGSDSEHRRGSLRGWRFGRALQAWIIYQRVDLRLSYNLINEAMAELFHEAVSKGTIAAIIKNFGSFYAETEQLIIQRLLASPCIHADETKINIQGAEEYVWVFTDGQRVVFRLTETREADLAHEFLRDYQGVLISDFYGGYDGLACRQQKCLVHLIRDLNNDLWSAPFDREFETFVAEVKGLLSPMLEAAKKYGLKVRHLRKFQSAVDKFYVKNILCGSSTNELVMKYQKRFLRYKQSLFLFLEMDGIPWHNNAAENAIRPLAVQRKISGTFYKNVAPQYLLLLGIARTCKYQDKSFLQFLLSGEANVDTFEAGRQKTSITFTEARISSVTL